MTSRELEDYKRVLAEAVMPEDATMAERRLAYDELGDEFPADETVGRQQTDLGGVPAWRFDPPDAKPDQAILYFHGGGYAMGSTKSHGMIITRLARETGTPLYFPDYRMAPEHVFPTALDDCVAAYRGLLDSGIKPESIAFAGDSAGGGLVFTVMMRARDQGLPQPSCGVAISPWSDMEGEGTWRAGDPARDAFLTADELDIFVDVYLGGKNLHHPDVAPHLGDLSGLAPVLIQVGSTELLFDDARQLAEGMKAAGGDVRMEVVEEAPHVWHHLVPNVPEAVTSIRQASQFITGHVS